MKKELLHRQIRVSWVIWTILSVLALILVNRLTSWRYVTGEAGSVFALWADLARQGDFPALLVAFAVPASAAAVIGWVLASVVGIALLPFRRPEITHAPLPRREAITIGVLVIISVGITLLILIELLNQ